MQVTWREFETASVCPLVVMHQGDIGSNIFLFGISTQIFLSSQGLKISSCSSYSAAHASTALCCISTSADTSSSDAFARKITRKFAPPLRRLDRRRGYLENQLEDVVRHVIVARGLLHQVESLDEFEGVDFLVEL